MAAATVATPRRRELTLLDCFGIGINGVIGSGIFLLPAVLYRRAGGASPLAWLLVGALCALVALCFAEAAGTTDRSGGAYRYASDAFGPRLGFAVGWITLVSSLFGYAAVARGFSQHVAWMMGAGGSFLAERAVAVLLIAALALVNVLGLKPSARLGDGVSLVKAVALVAFVVFGLRHFAPAALHAAPSPAPGEPSGLMSAAFAGLFACSGFEYVPAPAGDTINPQRSVGLAMVLTVVVATVLYALVQLVVISTLHQPSEQSTPLVDAARVFAGPLGAELVAGAAVVSAFGFCSSSALVGPRYVETFAQDAFLPAWLERRSLRLGTPVQAIVMSSLAVGLIALTLDFARLADISNIAVVVQYVSTCLAVLVLRRRGPAWGARRFRIPFGPLVPLLALGGSLLFLTTVSVQELAVGSAAMAAGGLLAWLARRRRAPAAADQSS